MKISPPLPAISGKALAEDRLDRTMTKLKGNSLLLFHWQISISGRRTSLTTSSANAASFASGIALRIFSLLQHQGYLTEAPIDIKTNKSFEDIRSVV